MNELSVRDTQRRVDSAFDLLQRIFVTVATAAAIVGAAFLLFCDVG